MVVGLVGCGIWGANVLRDLRALECEVRVVARSEASVARARAGGADAVVSEIDELGRLDGVVIVTPIDTHAALVAEALALDVPVFVEKPLCDDAADAARLAALAPDRLFVMDKWRYHPGVAALTAVAAAGRLGRVQGLRTVRVQSGNRHRGDCIWVLAPHDLAIAVEILGEVPRPIAARGHWAGDRLLTLHGLLETDRAWHAVEFSERAPAAERRVELHCDDGVAILGGGWDEHVLVHAAGGGTERLEAVGELPLLAELRAFVGFLGGDPPPMSAGTRAASSTAARRRDAIAETSTSTTRNATKSVFNRGTSKSAAIGEDGNPGHPRASSGSPRPAVVSPGVSLLPSACPAALGGESAVP